jgi:hypothetical protein
MRTLLFSSILVGSLLSAGCALDPEEPTGDAQERQVSPWRDGTRRITMTFADTAVTQFATIIIVSRTNGTFQPGNEYWYVNRDALGLLGSTALDISVADYRTGGLDDPSYVHEQQFTEVEFPTSGWGSAWTSDPLSGGTLLGDGSSIYLRVTTGTSGNVSRVAWYQVIPTTQSPQYLVPSGRFSVYSGGSVSVPTGYRGYDIDQAVP